MVHPLSTTREVMMQLHHCVRVAPSTLEPRRPKMSWANKKPWNVRVGGDRLDGNGWAWMAMVMIATKVK